MSLAYIYKQKKSNIDKYMRTLNTVCAVLQFILSVSNTRGKNRVVLTLESVITGLSDLLQLILN